MKRRNIISRVSKINLWLVGLLNLGFVLDNIYAYLSGKIFYSVFNYLVVVNVLISPIVVLSFLILLFMERRKALKWWRIMLIIYPALYVLVTINDVVSYDLGLIDLLDSNAPVLYRIE